MRNTRVDDYEDVPRAVVALGNHYPSQKEVPPERAVWIPPGVCPATGA